MEVLKQVLKEIKPTAEEEKKVISKVNAFVKKINTGLKDAKAELYGSGAKGTWLKGGFDADVFVKYNYSKFAERSDEISKLLGKHLRKKKFKFTVMHGSRDYFRIKQDGFIYEVIPILDIKKSSEAKNITDISPLHAKWVKANGKRYIDDIRLAKAFLRANELYGAESYIRGFSGYVTEILVIYYKGFLGFLRGALKWKDKQVIDIKKYHKDVFMALNKSKLDSPIIVVDPVDKTRNAAAALSYDKVVELKELAKKFLKDKSKRFFEKEEVTEESLRKKSKGKKLVIIDVEALSGKEDIVGAKIMKSYNFILRRLKEKEFKVIDSGWKWDRAKKAMMWFILDKKELSNYKEHPGPGLESKEHCIRFKKQHKNVFKKKGRLYAKVKRDFVNAESYIKVLLKDGWFKDKVKKIAIKDV
ncbi:CCA tRNA nucleotidyltransferase [Candidatus Woesearchaeota archaeon]|nr:CCA tRNA nucleotidyltransferase [Candidatus Woesearchaeota archaeon]